jgi:nitronate monooxygenase
MPKFPFVDVPIVQAPMAGATTPRLVAAVSNAGGLGSLPLGWTEPAKIPALIAEVRALTERPFAVNLFVDTSSPVEDAVLQRSHDQLRRFRDELGIPHAPVAPRAKISFEEQFEAVFAARPAVFSFTFGIPGDGVLERCRAAGIYTIGTANTVDEAIALERAGVDAVCAQGFEAGGHHGPFIAPVEDSDIGTLALVPQVVDAVSVPVLAAGGVTDGRGVAAVLALGAAAAAVGSAFLLADESSVPPASRRVLASDANRRTTLTAVFSGRTARGIRNRFIDEMRGAEIAPYPYQNALTSDIRNAATAQERPEYLSLWTGQAVALARSEPAAAIVERLVAEARRAVEADREALACR